MLAELHTAITNLLYDRGRIPHGAVDVSFAMPTRELIESLVRPTISLFLFDVAENTDLRHTNMQPGRSERNGREVGVQRMPPRRFNLRYMVSTPNTLIEHEHLLFWRTLVTLLQHPQLPADVLAATIGAVLRRDGQIPPNVAPQIPQRGPQPTLAELQRFVETTELDEMVRAALLALTLEPPITMQIVRADEGARLSELWGALDLPPRPTLLYTVTVPVQLGITYEWPLVLRRETRYTSSGPAGFGAVVDLKQDGDTEHDADRLSHDGVQLDHTASAIGGVVLDRAGRSVKDALVEVISGGAARAMTNSHGRFQLPNIRPGALQLRVTTRDGAATEIACVVPPQQPSEPLQLTLD